MKAKLILLIAFISLMLASLSMGALTDDIRVWYSFDDNTSYTTDETGNGWTGNPQGVTYLPEGFCGDGAYSFDGASVVYANYNISDFAGSFSVNLWVKRDNTGEYDWLFEYDYRDSPYQKIEANFHNNDYIRFLLTEDSDTSKTNVTWCDEFDFDLNDTTNWHMITFVRDNATNISIYYDTVSCGAIPDGLGTVFNPAGTSFRLGNNYNNASTTWLDGDLDEFAMWDRALTQDDINELYNSGDCYNPYIIYYTITASSADNGSITPSGNVIVEENKDTSFNISADEWYEINDVLIDDVSQGALTNYTFINVTSNHTIYANFSFTGECFIGLDCGVGYTCSNYTCYPPECTDDSNCNSDEDCVNYVCIENALSFWTKLGNMFVNNIFATMVIFIVIAVFIGVGVKYFWDR